jgi:hypothetical protein
VGCGMMCSNKFHYEIECSTCALYVILGMEFWYRDCGISPCRSGIDMGGGGAQLARKYDRGILQVLFFQPRPLIQ